MILRHAGPIRRNPHTPGIAKGMVVALIAFLVVVVVAAAARALQTNIFAFRIKATVSY